MKNEKYFSFIFEYCVVQAEKLVCMILIFLVKIAAAKIDLCYALQLI